MAEGTKFCKTCETTKPLSQFYKTKRGYKNHYYYSARCKPCERAFRVESRPYRVEAAVGIGAKYTNDKRLFPTPPLVQWLEVFAKNHDLIEELGLDLARYATDLMKGKQGQVNIDKLDEIFMRLDEPWRINELYPPELEDWQKDEAV